jgi:hypothetical protein
MQIDSDKHQLCWMLQMAQNLQMDDVAFCSRDYGMLSMSLRSYHCHEFQIPIRGFYSQIIN